MERQQFLSFERNFCHLTNSSLLSQTRSSQKAKADLDKAENNTRDLSDVHSLRAKLKATKTAGVEAQKAAFLGRMQ